MKALKTLFLILILPLIGITWECLGSAQDYLSQNKFMSLQDAQKHWGQKSFSPEGFKAAPQKEKAAMAYDLIKSKALVGKTATEVKSLLGPTSGYFWSKRVPTYFIEEGWQKNQDSWQLVFLIDENERVTEVRIHKNCCDKTVK